MYVGMTMNIILSLAIFNIIVVRLLIKKHASKNNNDIKIQYLLYQAFTLG